MFTGIITNLGKIQSLENNSNQDLLLKIATTQNLIEKRKLEIGCSIAVNGACLTLISKEIKAENIIFAFQASKETCVKTTLANFKIGEIVNLEFALRVGDELGGHMVSGHVDKVINLSEIAQIDESHKFTFKVDLDLMKFIAAKGSAVINGVSLTVNEVFDDGFSVNIIPHTFANTNFCNLKIGDEVNLEIDLVARYLAKLNSK